MILKTYNTVFDEIMATFTDQNGRPLEIEGKVNLTLLIDPLFYSIEPRTRKYVKGYGFLSFAKNLSKKYKKTYCIQD